MMTLKPLLIFASIYIALVGCSDKKDSTTLKCLLATEIETSANVDGITTTTYTYNSNNKVVSTSAYSTFSDGATYTLNTTFSYDGRGRIISYLVSSIVNGGPPSALTYTLTYNGNRISQIVSSYDKTVLTYNSSGQATKEDYYLYSGTAYNLDGYRVYAYPNASTKNYSSITFYDATDTQLLNESYLYDTKQSLEAQRSLGNPVNPTNNFTQVIAKYSGSAPTVSNIAYTYNNNGFPLTMIASGNGNTTTYTFTYTNCK